MSILKKNGAYIAMAVIIIGITAGNYYLSGGAKSNWVEISDYGFKMLHPPARDVFRIGLDPDYVFDINGRIPASSDAGMLNFNVDNNEYGLTWAAMGGEPTLEEVLDIFYNSVEVNAIRRGRVAEITSDPMTFGEVNGHEAAYQIHLLELDMPNMDDNLYARGLVVGWTCDESGTSFTYYILHWNTGTVPNINDVELLNKLNMYLDTVECH